MANKIFRIVINGRAYWAKYFNKGTAKKNKKAGKSGICTINGWHIDIPSGYWWFDATIPNMKREVLRRYPSATFHRCK